MPLPPRMMSACRSSFWPSVQLAAVDLVHHGDGDGEFLHAVALGDVVGVVLDDRSAAPRRLSTSAMCECQVPPALAFCRSYTRRIRSAGGSERSAATAAAGEPTSGTAAAPAPSAMAARRVSLFVMLRTLTTRHDRFNMTNPICRAFNV